MTTQEDPRWSQVTCAKCGETGQCTPWNDYYETPLWDGEGRVCESCFKPMVWAHMRRDRS